ncbi:Glycosyltransferase OS=Streptomyces paromomycinus OX=92743 GN=GKJPGBOP_03145 PE=4 SV=1 [Streptomyces rimosus subsp. rimosus]
MSYPDGACGPPQEAAGTPVRRLLGVPRQRRRSAASRASDGAAGERAAAGRAAGRAARRAAREAAKQATAQATGAAKAQAAGTLAFVESPVQLLNVLEWAHGEQAAALTVVVLAPHDPMTRGQLRRMAELAREEGFSVRWEEARDGAAAPLRTIGGLTRRLRRAGRVVIGDPFSRYVQLLLTLTRARDLIVVDDGTATMEFITQLANGERLVRWHRHGGGRGPRDLAFAPFAAAARRRLGPAPEGGRRTVGLFTSMPVEPPPGIRVLSNEFAWTRRRFGPPRLTRGTDIVGTSLVETGVIDPDRYLEAVHALARTHGATRYFAHRRESAGKLHRLAAETGLEIVRPDLPLELIARRGPIGRQVLSFPLHRRPHAAPRTGRNRGRRRGVRHRPGLADQQGVAAGRGLPVRGDGNGAGRTPSSCRTV